MVLPADLPFYSSQEKVEYTLVKQEPSSLELGLRTVREGLGELLAQGREARDRVDTFLETGRAHSQAAYGQLLDEENLPVRLGVVAGCGALGLLVGVARGRLVKRVLYTGLGAGAGAAACFPAECSGAAAVVEVEGRRAVDRVVSLATGGPVTSNTLDMSLVAASIRQSLFFLARQARELYRLAVEQATSLQGEVSRGLEYQSSPAGPGSSTVAEAVPQISVVTGTAEEVLSSSKSASSRVFLAPSSPVEGVKGDVGMGREEDSDLYTTRGN